MKIARIDTIGIKVPFVSGGPPGGFGGRPWLTNDICLVRVETDNGIVGWGEAFCYGIMDSVRACIEKTLAPIAVGRDARDIGPLSRDLQQNLHLLGRYGITMFALSGLDIALWDIAGKAAGVPLCRLLGGAPRDVPAYASLFRIGKADLVGARTQLAVDEGYRWIKLHEKEVPEVRIAREVAGPDIPIMVDVNCPWTPEQAKENALKLAPFDMHWLEEPIFPPEDFRSLAALRRETGVALAAGENACTAFQFHEMLRVHAVDYVQPSVTKVGGITEFRKVMALASTYGITVMPHSPYFGPGFLATLHLAACQGEPGGLIERFHIDLEASLYGMWIDPVKGMFKVPDGPGLGVEPDEAVIRKYKV